MITLRLTILALIVFSLIKLASGQDKGIIINEASGICRHGDKLLIVSDDSPGMYFEFPIPKNDYPIIPLDPHKVSQVKLPGAELAADPEAIGVLADGRIVVLSELMHCLIGKPELNRETYSIIAYYDKSLSEVGNRGLEGLAIKDIGNGNSRLAVLWEGGYPVVSILPETLKDIVSGKALKPIVEIHEIAQGKTGGAVFDPIYRFMLDVPRPEGDEPLAQRYRGSALVWHKWINTKGKQQDGLIVLLQSENSPPENSDIANRYQYKILQRFDLEGNPIGEPLDINRFAKAAFESLDSEFYSSIGPEMSSHIKELKTILDKRSWENINWEGMAWFKPGKSLVLIYDTVPKNPPFALILEIPQSWQ